jgi:hypothetical protein
MRRLVVLVKPMRPLKISHALPHARRRRRRWAWQERAWHFIETFYAEQEEENSGYVTDAYLRGIASQVTGLDLARWTSDQRDPALGNEITGDARTAENAGLTGTPSFLIGASGDAMSRRQRKAVRWRWQVRPANVPVLRDVGCPSLEQRTNTRAISCTLLHE